MITLETVYAPNLRAVLLDHLVGAGEMRGWNGEAERPGGLKVDDQLERVGGELVNFGVNRSYGAVLCRLAGVIIFSSCAICSS